MKFELTKIGSALRALLRKDNNMATRGTNAGELRDRVAYLERELQKTQERVQKDIKSLYEAIKASNRGNRQ